ncbi:hypothetical protein BD626DRAFT_216083 [Schizophyllum amplum]|uniref:HNH nuclease domain-containing protein n=1 Tax=Schizophyllum amplum TaxID=97359 RepID=A0A550CKG9_9AGAR|nr:hypothetical protein BD626DRAFT_216083 [Auriculariopsis ampla]
MEGPSTRVIDPPYIPTPGKRKAAPNEPDPAHALPPHKRRRKIAATIQTARKRAVDEEVKLQDPSVTKNYRTRCVVSRATDKLTLLEYVHVLPAATRSKKLDLLEWCWGLARYTLNVDSRKNIHPLRSSMHKWFDTTKDKKAIGWFWLPTDLLVLLSMHAFYVKGKKAHPEEPDRQRDIGQFYANATSFEYRFIAFPEMATSWSVIQHDGHSTVADHSSVTFHHYPFSTMDPIQLHVPYHYVVANTGKKLRIRYDTSPTMAELASDFPFLHADLALCMSLVWEIYDAWMHADPDPDWMKNGRRSGDDHGGSSVPKGGGQLDQGDMSAHDAAADGRRRSKDASEDSQGRGVGAARSPEHESDHPLAPEDSASCRAVSEDSAERSIDDEAPPVDEEEEWEDPEYFDWMKTWVDDVWRATHSENLPPSGSDETANAGMS